MTRLLEIFLICSAVILHFSTASGDCEALQHPQHELAKRSLFLEEGFNSTYALITLDRLYGPKTYMQQIFVAGTNMVVRQVATGLLGFLYHYTSLRNLLGDSFDSFFARRSFDITLWRNLRNYSSMMFGRFVIDLIFYGPALTFDGIVNTFTFRELYDFWTGAGNVSAFIYRFLLEGPSLVLGWILVGVLGGNIPLSADRDNRGRSGIAAPGFPEDVDVAKQISDGFLNVLDSFKEDDDYLWV